MLRPVMTALAEFRRLPGQEFIVIATMRSIAVQAIFFDRRMLPHERPPLFSVAGITEFVDRIGFDLLIAERAVDIVTAAAFDQAFF